MLKISSHDDYHFTEDSSGMFQSGIPVKFPYLRNKESAPDFGERYQQHIEPAGRYMIQNEVPDSPLTDNWESGDVSFTHPLVIAFNTEPDNSSYDEHSWKARLSRIYGGKTGLELSKAILADGYDGIVTVYIDNRGNPAYTKEIVDLTPIKEKL